MSLYFEEIPIDDSKCILKWVKLDNDGATPSSRGGYGIAYGHNGILIGGANRIETFGDCFSFNIDFMDSLVKWTKLNSNALTPHTGACLVSLSHNNFFLHGGIVPELQIPYTKPILFSNNTIQSPTTFDSRSDFAAPRSSHLIIPLSDGWILSFGGATMTGFTNDIIFMNPSKDKYISLPKSIADCPEREMLSGCIIPSIPADPIGSIRVLLGSGRSDEDKYLHDWHVLLISMDLDDKEEPTPKIKFSQRLKKAPFAFAGFTSHALRWRVVNNKTITDIVILGGIGDKGHLFAERCNGIQNDSPFAATDSLIVGTLITDHSTGNSSIGWRVEDISGMRLPQPRFAAGSVSIPLSSSIDEATDGDWKLLTRGIFMFGGSNLNEDFNDSWLLMFKDGKNEVFTE